MAMLRELIEKVGMTGEQAWPHVVAHVRADALVGVVGGVFSLIVAIALFGAVFVSLYWCPRAEEEIEQTRYGERDTVYRKGERMLTELRMGSCAGITAVALIMCVTAALVLGRNFPDLLEPTGATIRAIIGR